MRDNMQLYEKLETFIPNHKLGFKILKDKQLENIFPTYEILLEKIDYHRHKLNEHGKITGLDSQYNLMYDNVYSIMGERGSGKTSALFTIKKKIEERYPNDWVLPVIMPEMLPENADVIGWILATLGDVVDKLEKKIEKNEKVRDDSAYFRDCKFKANNDLRKAYNKVKELHFSKNSQGYQQESLSVASDNFEIQTFNGFDFAKAFSHLWDMLVDAISKSDSSVEGENPLIYIMFDDVDLTPHRIMDILSSIIKYLAHPNLIVLITAEESLFYEVVFNQLCAKLDKRQVDETIMRRTAHLYVDKVMPPSSRFYLEMFDDCEKKKNFIQIIESQNKNTENKTLEDFLREQVHDYIKARVSKKNIKEYDNFLYYEGNKDHFLHTYFLFWGNTSRQLVNESLIVSNFISSLKHSFEKAKEGGDTKHYKEEVYKHVYGFIKSSIISNINLRNMLDDVEQFVNMICNKNKTRWPIFINYEALEKFYFEKEPEFEEEEDKRKFAERIIAIFVTLFFAENLLLIGDKVNDKWRISKERRYVHGAKNLVTILDSLLPNTTISLARDNRDFDAVTQLLFNYSHVLSNPGWLFKYSLYCYSDVKEYMFPLYSREETHAITSEELYRWHIESPRWFNAMTRMVFLMSTGIYALNKRTANDLLWAKNIKIHDQYVSSMLELGQRELKKQLTDAYVTVNKEDAYPSYNTYVILYHRTKMFEVLHEEFDLREDSYNLEEVKQRMIEIFAQDNQAQGQEKESPERMLRKVSFVNVVSKEVWGHDRLTKDVIRGEIRKVQNSLMQYYGLTDTYCMNDPDLAIERLQELKQYDVPREIKEYIDYLVMELEVSNRLQVVAFNRFIELLDEHLKEEERYPWNNNIKIKNIQEELLGDIHLLFEMQETILPIIGMIMQHEALLYLQELYVGILMNEMRELLREQGIVENSFYKKYLATMLDVLRRGKYIKADLSKGENIRPEMYLGRYMKEIIQDTVDEYLVECEILPTKKVES